MNYTGWIAVAIAVLQIVKDSMDDQADRRLLLSFAISQLNGALMSKAWVFIGGALAGIIGVFTAAAVAVELDNRKADQEIEDEPEKLELPEGGQKQGATDRNLMGSGNILASLSLNDEIVDYSPKQVGI